MNKRNTINIALFIFILIAAGLAFFDDSDNKKNIKQAITSLKQTDVVNITIKRQNKKEIYLEKINNQWRLVSPYNTPTNEFRIDTLLRLVETLPQSSYPLKQTAPYGLDKPVLEVLFNKGLDNSVLIKFGNSEPIKLRRYVAVGDKLYLTNDTYFYALNSVATDYISHKLLEDNFKITQLDLPGLQLKIENGNWKATPEPENFSVDSVNELISEWKNAQAIDISPIDTSKPFISSQVISLSSKDATRLTFYILKNDKEFVLIDKLKGLQYSFPKEKEKQLLSLPEPVTDTPSEPVPRK